DIVPGLPAEEVLRIGDRITHLDGIRLTSNEDLIRYVQYRQPGDEIQVTIRRPQLVNREIDDVAQQDTLEFTVMTVTLKLGSAELLSRTGVAGESPVLVERRMQAQSIKRMHAMKARTVSFDSPLAEEFVFEPQRALESAEIDRAPEVALLLRQLEMVNSGQMELTPVLQRTWIDNLNRLRQMSMDPSLSEFQQLYLERIVERYEELILP
ncbi:MAG: PDZ domain-containing protein, partial [Phycisphaerales bacterium]|nr:PDZ domain-containing protein [Phycisphaerales bacterium]